MSPRQTSLSQSANLKTFAPDDCTALTEHSAITGLRLSGEPEEFIRSFTSKIYAHESGSEEKYDSPEDGELVATAQFSYVATGAWGGDGDSLRLDFADAVSGELLEIVDALFDEDGSIRDELDVSGFGSDFLHIEMIEVTPGYDTFQVVRHLLQYILERYGHGCMGAVYYQASWESIGVARPLKERGFKQIRTKNRHVWLIDLGVIHPPLDNETASSAPEE